MPWQIVQQPNHYLAIFSTVVDDFTWYNMTKAEALNVCIKEEDLGPALARRKIQNGIDAGPQRFNEAIKTIRAIHGRKRAKEVKEQLSKPPDD